MNARTMTSAPRSLSRLFDPRSVAIVGASADRNKTSGRPLHYLDQHGYTGALFPVNPGRTEIQGRKCYPNLTSIGEPVDLALILSSATQVEEVVMEGIACGIRNFIVFGSGFAELGADGAAMQARLAEQARRSGANIVGPNCVGIMNVDSRLCATIASVGELAQFRPGVASLVSQSGAISGYWLDKVLRSGMGFSKWISSGNECDVDLADAIEFLAGDDRTRIISLYIESIRDAEKLARAIRTARANGKSLVALRSGLSEAGKAAVASHTAALVTDNAVVEAFLSQHGVAQVRSISEMVDVAKILASSPMKALKDPVVVTISGGAGALVADSLSHAGFSISQPDRATAERVHQILPSFGKAANPLDVTGAAGAQPKLFSDCLEAILSDGQYGFAIVFLGLLHGISHELAEGIVEVTKRTRRPTVVIWMSAPEQVVHFLQAHEIPVFDDIPQAVSAIAQANTAIGTEVAPPAVARNPGDMRCEGGALSEYGSRKAFPGLASLPIRLPRSALVRSTAEVEACVREVGLPVVAKLQSNQLLHKTEHGGVQIGIADADSARLAVDRMLRIGERLGIRCEGVMLQEKVEFEHEMILGLKWNPVFGPVLLLGRGGVHVEYDSDAAVLTLPCGAAQIERAMRGLRYAHAMLRPRKGPPIDLGTVARKIAAVCDYYVDQTSIFEIEFNPLVIQSSGELWALDILTRSAACRATSEGVGP